MEEAEKETGAWEHPKQFSKDFRPTVAAEVAPDVGKVKGAATKSNLPKELR